jgi:glucokinase
MTESEFPVLGGAELDRDAAVGASPFDAQGEALSPDETSDEDGSEAVDTEVPRRDVVLAVDIGGTKFAAGLVTAQGELLDRARVDVERDVVPEAHYTSLAGMVSEMIERAHDQHHARIRAVGVGSAGPVERDLETVSPVNIPAWREFPLRARLHDTTGLPVYGDLDAKALALAEGWLGAAQGHPNFCALTVSTGVGGGVVLDGELLDGNTGNAGHIGHVIVEPGGRRCGCGAQGCLEAEASGLAIEAITGRPPTEPTYEIMQRTGRLVGLSAASICNLLDLSLVVVGGSVALGFAATFFHSAQVVLDDQAKLSYSRGARITPSRLADSGPLIGAGAIAWRGAHRARLARAERRTVPVPRSADSEASPPDVAGVSP